MQGLKISLLAASGTLVVAASGTLWWLAPMAAFTGLVAYEHTTPEAERPLLLQSGGDLRLLAAPVQAARAINHWRRTGELPGRKALPAPAEAAPEDISGYLAWIDESLEADTQRRRQEQHRPQQAQVAERSQPTQLAERPRWLEVVNDDMDRAPHALILGPSGAGKTTLATAIMGDRGGRSVVISPKVAPGNWRGAEVVTLDDDGTYAPLADALNELELEKRRRIVTLRKQGPEALEPLTIVLDELQQLTTHVPAAGEFMVGLSSIGRELKIRMVGIGTTDDALNIRGWKASRGNYVRIELDRDRRATLSDGVRDLTLNTKDALPMAKGAQLRPWRGEAEVIQVPSTATTQNLRPVTYAREASQPDALLASLMAELPAAVREAVPDISPERGARLAQILERQAGDEGPPSKTQQVAATVRRDGGDVYLNVDVQQVAPAGGRRRRRGQGLDMAARRVRADKYRQVRSLVQEGKSGNEIDRALPGERKEILAMVRQAKAELGV